MQVTTSKTQLTALMQIQKWRARTVPVQDVHVDLRQSDKNIGICYQNCYVQHLRALNEDILTRVDCKTVYVRIDIIVCGGW